MSKKPVIECVRNYILNFPQLKGGCLLVDILRNKPVEYVVESVPCDPMYKRYVDGGGLKQFVFIFASREYFNESITTNIANLGFYEEFESWISGNNFEGILPDLGEGREPISLEVTTCGYAYSADEKTARYQIQLRLIYEED